MNHGMTGDPPRIAYADTGPRDGAALVLLHSLGTDHRMWQDQARALAERWRVLLPDSRGHGTSEWAGPLTVDVWAADLDRVLDATGVARAALVGVSMGGIQALTYAAAHPDRVSAVVVADSFVELDATVAQTKIAELAGLAREEGMAALADSYLADTFVRWPLSLSAETARKAIADMDVDAYAESVRACFEVRIADRLGAVRAPALVLWGELDHRAPRQLSERIVAGIAGAELRSVPDAGHLSNMENPAAFTRLVEDFLTARVAAGPIGGD